MLCALSFVDATREDETSVSLVGRRGEAGTADGEAARRLVIIAVAARCGMRRGVGGTAPPVVAVGRRPLRPGTDGGAAARPVGSRGEAAPLADCGPPSTAPLRSSLKAEGWTGTAVDEEPPSSGVPPATARCSPPPSPPRVRTTEAPFEELVRETTIEDPLLNVLLLLAAVSDAAVACRLMALPWAEEGTAGSKAEGAPAGGGRRGVAIGPMRVKS